MMRPVLRLLLAAAMALSVAAGAVAGQPLAEAVPDKSWACQLKPGAGDSGPRATFYFFDQPLVVERYSPETGFDQVDGITVIAHVLDPRGKVAEYTFGVFSLDYQAYQITMRFSARPSPTGLKLVNFPESVEVAVIDRISGEMRSLGDERGAGRLQCEAVAGTFAEMVRDYQQALTAAMRAHGRKDSK